MRVGLGISLVALVSALGLLSAGQATAAPVTTDNVLLQTVKPPWEDKFNVKAMAAAFGSNWETQDFGAVQADEGTGGLFAPHVRFIWIEGSSYSTEAAREFIRSHESALKAFVSRGGGLFIDSATEQEILLEYDGRTVGRLGSGVYFDSLTIEAVADNHPIFLGPATPNATSFKSGGYGPCAMGTVDGPALTPLMIGDQESGPLTAVVLAEYASGSGHVILGTLALPEWQIPADAARSLRINILAYLSKPPPPVVSRSNAFILGKPRLNKKKGTAIEPVAVPGPGQITLAGKQVRTFSSVVSSERTVNLPVKLKGQRRRRMLKRGGGAKVTITVTYTPTGGAPSSQSRKVVLTKRLH